MAAAMMTRLSFFSGTPALPAKDLSLSQIQHTSFPPSIGYQPQPTSTRSGSHRRSKSRLTTGSLILIQQPDQDSGSRANFLFQVSSSSSASGPDGRSHILGRLLRASDWDQLIHFNRNPRQIWDSQLLNLEDIVNADTDATINPSRRLLASIDPFERRHCLGCKAEEVELAPSLQRLQQARTTFRWYKKARKLDVQESCPICKSEFEDTDDLSGLECGHLFHYRCLREALVVRPEECPICRCRPVSRGGSP